mmetsp:Transcript_353/g.795  ORF Transcript_353/g.795 Transcript_353/m.795 type:complete len:346 (+) Transcript_353:167-1204(+)
MAAAVLGTPVVIASRASVSRVRCHSSRSNQLAGNLRLMCTRQRRGALKVNGALAASSSSTPAQPQPQGWGAARHGRSCIGNTRSRRGMNNSRQQQHQQAPELLFGVPSSTANAESAFSGSSDGDSSLAGGPVAQFTRGLKARIAADPNFGFKLGAEVCLDEIMTLAVNIGVRGNPLEWTMAAQLNVVCQMLTAAINDIILVYCLAPVRQEEGGKDEATKKPEIAHIFQEGGFTVGERIGCYLSKGRFYAMVGAFSCTLSMALALTLSGQTSQLTAVYLFRALMTGALHMGISANTRYQMVNGIERFMYNVMPQGIARISSVGVRLCNNLLGARLWIAMTVFTGLA